MQEICVVLAAFVVSGHCGVLPGHLVAAPAPYAAINTDYDPAPQYAYAYNIQDSLTGDYKSQQESRDGDVVKGK